MVYKFKCDVKASDLWKLSMYTTYHSFLGVCNIVFAVAMFLLAFRFFGHSTWVVRIILIGLCMIFPVFQPLGTYGYACRQLEELPKNLELSFFEKYIHVHTDDKFEDVPYNKVSRIIRKSDIIMLVVGQKRCYMLTKRSLGEQEEAFVNFIEQKIAGK